MFDVVIVFSETLDLASDLTDRLFKSLDPLECALVSTNFKLSAEDVTTEMA